MKQILNKVFRGETLSEEDIFSVINNDNAAPEQVAALLGALEARSITPFELGAFFRAIKQNSSQPKLRSKKGFIDVCGTGGDCSNTFNISTTVSFVAAASGVSVIKHGNRSVSSKCGSADVLEYLKVKIDTPKEDLQKTLDRAGMVFLYAPEFNKTLAKIKKIRNAIAAPTVFNLLGPLVNPVELDYQIIGVYDKKRCALVADSLRYSSVKEAMVVYNYNGLDELSTTGENLIYHLKEGKIKTLELPPLENLGLKKAQIEDLRGDDAKTNASYIEGILNGEKGPKRDVVLLNAAAALIAAHEAKDFFEGVQKAAELIDSSRALKVLEELRKCS